jgi:hypothetical protein
MRIVIGLLVLLTCGWAHAAPLVHFKLEGRRQGSADPFASNVQVSVGDVVEYRLRLRMATPDMTNVNLEPNRAQPGKHGVNSLSIAIVQDAHDLIQVDLNSPAELASGWDQQVGFSGGTPSPRAAQDWHDLLDIRPIQQPGVFRGTTEITVLSGLLNVAAISGISGQVCPEWGSTSGAGSFNGDVFFVVGPNHENPDYRQQATESRSDPFTEFAPLILTAAFAPPIPEPSAAVLAATALAIVFLLRMRIARA